MRRWLAGMLFLASFGARGAERAPVLLELFTSEGCSSCPPADEALSSLAREQPVSGAQIIPLELHVDYWNSLGWADPFSLPEATARQEHYAAAGTGASDSQLFTPQMVVDGTRSFVGNAELARAAVAQAVARPKRRVHAALRAVPGGVDVELQVGPGEDKPAALWVVLTESGLSSRVTRGENRGRTLFHAPVVRSLEQVAVVPGGGWTGTVRLSLAQAWRREALSVVAFAQERASGRVVGITTAAVPGGASASSH
ncbi:MAG: DUF1223 domain-containing protein [Myxococcaceae bacterium]